MIKIKFNINIMTSFINKLIYKKMKHLNEKVINYFKLLHNNVQSMKSTISPNSIALLVSPTIKTQKTPTMVRKILFLSTSMTMAFFFSNILALAQENQSANPTENKSKSSPGIPESIKQAGELALSGDSVKALEIVRNAMKDCQQMTGESRDCSDWLRSLQGLNMLIDSGKKTTATSNSIGMRLVRIPAQEYMMGSPKQEADWLRLTFRMIWREGHKQWFQDETPLHPVRITRPFYMGAYEVTVKQFRDFVNDTKYKTDAEKGDGGMIFSNKDNRWVPQKKMKWDSLPWKIADDQPVVFISWNDAQAFCKWLSRKEKKKYRLPTEAEWEMACRGGAVWARFPWGDKLPGDRDTNFGDGNSKLPESMTTVNDGHEQIAPVGSYPANGFGLYDMGGNVMEWVEDYYDRNYYETSPINDPQGPQAGTSRVNKGGNWFASPTDCRCAFRGFSGDTMSFWNLGFRVVMEEEPHIGNAQGLNSDQGQSLLSSPSEPLPPTEEDGIRLFRQAMFAAQQQQWDNATQDLEKALKLYEKRDDPKWIARVKATLAGIYAERNRTFKSKELYTEALSEFRKMGDSINARIILARLQELETSPGVKVLEVQKGGLADRVGIVPGDVLIEYAGETGLRVATVKKLVEEYSRTSQVTLSVSNSDTITTTVVPGGPLGVAIEDMKRPPRPPRPQEQNNQRSRRNQGQPRDRR